MCCMLLVVMVNVGLWCGYVLMCYFENVVCVMVSGVLLIGNVVNVWL